MNDVPFSSSFLITLLLEDELGFSSADLLVMKFVLLGYGLPLLEAVWGQDLHQALLITLLCNNSEIFRGGWGLKSMDFISQNGSPERICSWK